jgi:hypothetical protein
MIAIGIDISRKTTFPGSKGYLKEIKKDISRVVDRLFSDYDRHWDRYFKKNNISRIEGLLKREHYRLGKR